jgi:hypothetical protein
VDDVGVSNVHISPPRFYMLIYHLGMNNRPLDDRSSESYTHTVDMTNIITDLFQLFIYLFIYDLFKALTSFFFYIRCEKSTVIVTLYQICISMN